jgi:peptidoglycan/xylan/chitin deacetylase (PgdA/CDA1 family)
MPPPAPVRPAGPTVLARTDDFIILRAQSSDNYASLAETYLHDAALADILADVNGSDRPTAGQPVIVPLKAQNASGVFADGYQTVPILCYHQFSTGRSTDLMIMPRDSFIAQMEYLKANKYHVISLADFEGFLTAQKPIPPRSVVITVDDGFRSAYDIAYPVLKTYGFHATFFIYTDFFGGGRALTLPLIEEMRSSGLIDIQSHSKTHTSFTPPTVDNEKTPAYAARIKTEIDPPQAILERQLGTKVRSFAYPYGDASRLAVQYLRDRGYEVAVTVERGGNASFSDPLLLRRDMVYGNYTIADFQKVLRVYAPANLK